MTIDDETLIAYVDGELPHEAERRFEEALLRDGDLQRRVDEQRRLQTALRASLDPVLTEDIPANILNAAKTTPASRQWRMREAFRWTWIFGKTATQFQIRMAVGTAIAVIALVAVVSRQTGSESLFGDRNGVLFAQGTLASALETRLASDVQSGAHVGLTFRSKEGPICRTFSIAEKDGIACRSNNAWQVMALVDVGKRSTSEYQAAGSTMPPTLRTAVSGLIKGDPFDAAQERAARRHGWK